MRLDWKIVSGDVNRKHTTICWYRELDGATQRFYVSVNLDNTMDLFAEETWEEEFVCRVIKGHERETILCDEDVSYFFKKTMIKGDEDASCS